MVKSSSEDDGFNKGNKSGESGKIGKKASLVTNQ
jgi:hypothetical protein